MAEPSTITHRSLASARRRERRTLGRAGWLAALAPLVIPALVELHARGLTDVGWEALPGSWPIAAVIAALLLDGALTLARNPNYGRVLVLLGSLGFAALATLGLRDAPAEALALLLFVVLFTSWTFGAPEAGARGLSRRARADSRVARARAAAAGSIAMVLAMLGFQLTEVAFAPAYPLASVLITTGLAFRSGGLRQGALDFSLVGVGLLSLIAVVVLWQLPTAAMLSSCAVPIVLLVGLREEEPSEPLHHEATWRELMLEQPARLLVGTFAIAGVVGGVLLTLPVCATGEPVALIDAIFTAFSAVCVTGLTVVDTATVYSPTGQAVILGIIQLGGLGIMSFSTAAAVLLGQRLSLRQESMAVELFGGDGKHSLDVALRRMLVVTFVTELVGALLLAGFFWQRGDSLGEAVWRGAFTSISAYCNAGFAIQTDNLVGYQDHPGVLNVVAALIIIGGLGPAVVAGLFQARRGRPSLHSRIVLLVTAVLLILPTFLIAALEWNQSLAGMSPLHRLDNAWFQSVTTRTAGFNSVDFAAMSPATLTLVEALMFVGGSPGSTAGGIKTTTVFVLVAAIFTVTQQRDTVVWGGWRIPAATIYRAAAVLTLGLLSVVVALFVLLLTQEMELQTALFEVVSALGTVGLTIGGTAQLDTIGKLVIIVCMFLGRVAPLTLFLMFTRPAGRDPWEYPEQEISVG